LIRLAHRKGIKVIADVVDWLAADGRNVAFNFIKTVDTFLEKAVFNSMSDGVIAISSYLEKYYTNKVDNVIIIPPVVSKYRSNVAQNQEIIVMYAGSPFRTGGKVKNIHKIKDRLDLAVTAFSELYKMGRINFQFRIFGITKEQYIQAFPDQKILLDSVNTSIEFLGKRPMNEIQDELSRADFSLLFREITRGTTAGFPTKVVESMSCGTPMITTKTSDLADYIDDGQNGFFVDINNNKHLLVQLQRIMSLSIDEKAKLKENCFKNQQFIYTLFKARMKRLIDSTVN
jgi:glycosyltransferase involved in cell wall biosynthesis